MACNDSRRSCQAQACGGPSRRYARPSSAAAFAPKIFRLHVFADVQASNRLDHQRDAADLMRIVAAGEDAIGAGEVEREADRRAD